MAFLFQVPTLGGEQPFNLEAGTSMMFVGANGGGKTRLAVHIERALGELAHRISAHRALTLNPSVPKISEKLALKGMQTGHAAENAEIGNREGNRWGGKSATYLLNDYDFLVQALFAEQSNRCLVTHNQARAKMDIAAEATKFERLAEVWERLLPHRTLHISGDDIQASIAGSEDRYSAREMSDGERAIFYMIGQTLVAAKNSLLIIDEPELHVHRSIMGKLWDELEAARPDCGFVFITHDLEFAASRAAQKYVIRDYRPTPQWTIETVPETGDFDEAIVTLILGSRRPILFVEGGNTSLDLAVYRCGYPDWTVIPRGSCEEVIHSVVTMRANESLTRITCAGIVDADGRTDEELAYLDSLGIACLVVSEIENIFLLPNICRAIASSEGYTANETEARLAAMYEAVFALIDSEDARNSVALRNCRRQIDTRLKKIDLSGAPTPEAIAETISAHVASIRVEAVLGDFREKLDGAIANRDIPQLMACFDNKHLLTIAAEHLTAKKRQAFEGWLTRVLRNNTNLPLAVAIRNELPTVDAL